MFGRLQIHIQQNAVVDFGLGTQNLPFVQLLFAGLVRRLLARAVLLRFRLLARAVLFHLLRFEANFSFSPFGSEL